MLIMGAMHELSISESILSTVVQSAETNGVTKIVKIHLEVGELNDMKSEWLQYYFDYASKGTCAESAEIEIHKKPAEFTCHDCKKAFAINLKEAAKVRCPECAGSNCTLTGGNEFYIRDMEAV